MSFFESLCHFFRRRRRLSDAKVTSIFMLLGIGVLVPWNAFISAVPYFQGRICSIPGASEKFESWIGLLFNLSSVSALSLLMAWPWLKRNCLWRGYRIPGTNERLEEISIHNLAEISAVPVRQAPPQQQTHQLSHNHSFWFVTFPFLLFLLVFVVTDLLVVIKDMSDHVFLSLTLLGMVICGTGAAFAVAGIVATSGSFPANVGVNPFVSGQAIGGVAVSAANFLSAAAEDPDDYYNQHCNSNTTILSELESSSTSIRNNSCPPYEKLDTAVFLYFFVGAAVLLSCILGFDILNRSQEYETVHSERADTTTQEEEFRDEPSARNGLELQTNSPEEESAPDGLLRRLPSTTSSESAVTITSEAPTGIFQILHMVRGPAFCIYFTFLVTLALFPAWTSRLRSTRQCHGSRMSNDLFIPFTFVLFNIGDLGGRILAGKLEVGQISNFSTKLVAAALLRCLFFPLLLLCTGGSDPNRVQIHSDMYSVLVQSLFALSNGFLISLGFMKAPTLIPSTKEAQEKSSEILTLALSFGLLCGSLLSFPVATLTS